MLQHSQMRVSVLTAIQNNEAISAYWETYKKLLVKNVNLYKSYTTHSQFCPCTVISENRETT